MIIDRYLARASILVALSLDPSISWADLLFHQIEPFLNVSNYRTLDDVDPSTSITIEIAKGEYEPARVVIRDTENWGIMRASVSEVKNSLGDTLPSSAVEIRNVKRWPQLIPHAYNKDKAAPVHMVDELLVFDDTEALSGKWGSGQFTPPLLSTTFRTNFSGSDPKQLWLTIHAPETQATGFYTGYITLEGASKKSIIPIDITVLPFKLPVADKHFGIFYRGSLARNTRRVSSEDLLVQLIDIKKHGFNSLVINEYDLDFLPELIGHYKRAKLNGPIILNFPKSSRNDPKLLETARSLIANENIEHYIYGIDEPNSRKLIAEQVIFNSKLPSDARVFTSLLATTDDQLKRRGLSIDWINLNVKSGLTKLKSKANQKNQISTFYWQSYLEDAPRNRYYAGTFLLKTGLDGIYPYVYQAFHSVDPYATDTRVLGGSQIRSRRLYKNFNTTYPSLGSTIPTIQWESMREGIDDYRYAQLLLNLARKDSPEMLENVKHQLLEKAGSITYSESIPFQLDRNFNASSLTLFRRWMISRILDLMP